MIIIIDFGTVLESSEALSKAKADFDLLIIDHHEIPKGFEKIDIYMNPLLYGGKSDYTAGALACIISSCFSKIDIKKFAFISLIIEGGGHKYAMSFDISSIKNKEELNGIILNTLKKIIN